MGSLIAVVFIVLAANVFMVLRRLRSDNMSKSRKPALDEQKAASIREKLIYSRLEREQEEAERYIEKRRRTFALYEQVRKRADAAAQGAAAPYIDSNAGFPDPGPETGFPEDNARKSSSRIDDSLFIPFDDD